MAMLWLPWETAMIGRLRLTCSVYCEISDRENGNKLRKWLMQRLVIIGAYCGHSWYWPAPWRRRSIAYTSMITSLKQSRSDSRILSRSLANAACQSFLGSSPRWPGHAFTGQPLTSWTVQQQGFARCWPLASKEETTFCLRKGHH